MLYSLFHIHSMCHNTAITTGFKTWHVLLGIARSKCDGTRAETRFGLSAKRTSPLRLAGGGGPVQSTTGSRGVHIGSSNAGYTMV